MQELLQTEPGGREEKENVQLQNGVYHARLVFGGGQPFSVALHGVSSVNQAMKILETFQAKLQSLHCCFQ